MRAMSVDQKSLEHIKDVVCRLQHLFVILIRQPREYNLRQPRNLRLVLHAKNLVSLYISDML